MISSRILVVLLFASLFMFVGWAAPMLFYTHAPQGYFVEEHDFHASNATIGDDSNTMCFDRTFHQRSYGTVFVEMYLVADNGEKIEVYSTNNDRVFQEGRRTVSETVSLPPDIYAGTYRYERVYRMEVANGQIDRTFVFESDRFYVDHEGTEQHRCNRNI